MSKGLGVSPRTTSVPLGKDASAPLASGAREPIWLTPGLERERERERGGEREGEGEGERERERGRERDREGVTSFRKCSVGGSFGDLEIPPVILRIPLHCDLRRCELWLQSCPLWGLICAEDLVRWGVWLGRHIC